jgi:hypothetical protein
LESAAVGDGDSTANPTAATEGATRADGDAGAVTAEELPLINNVPDETVVVPV